MDSIGALISLTLLPGVGLLVVSTSNRLIYLTTRMREGQKTLDAQTDVAHCLRRVRMLHSALVALYVAATLLSFSALTGLMLDTWATEFAGILKVSVAKIILALAVLAISVATALLVRESVITMRALRREQGDLSK